jgi:CubicO group peptidase (beta-lactamase class C family)
MTARDLARFGYLFLRNGKWHGKTIVPQAWVKESTQAHSHTKAGEGYGYLWWVDGFDLPVSSFSAQGALAKYVVVVPARDLVVVYLNNTEFPDDVVGNDCRGRQEAADHYSRANGPATQVIAGHAVQCATLNMIGDSGAPNS